MSEIINNGGPAFPNLGYNADKNYNGMTLRDWFAGQAIGHLAVYAMTGGESRNGPEWRYAVATASYQFADAMLEAREVKP